MRIPSVLASAFSLALATLVVAEAASDVVDLTPSNFKSVVDPEKLILVEFFAPWYPLTLVHFSVSHCNSLSVR
jgi:protein disulfide-isomerase A1